jgi:membrane protein
MLFGQYNKMYGTIGAAIVVLLWFYPSGLALVVGAELNAEIEHASPIARMKARRCLASIGTGCFVRAATAGSARRPIPRCGPQPANGRCVRRNPQKSDGQP